MPKSPGAKSLRKSGVLARSTLPPTTVSEAAQSWFGHTTERLNELAPVAAVYPGVYTLGVLEALSEQRDNLNAQIRTLVEIGSLQLGVSNRQLSDAAKISSATANRWTDRGNPDDPDPGLFSDIVMPPSTKNRTAE